MSDRTLLFSVTASNCDFDFVRGSGKGGQKRNKTSNAVRCRHRDSGAVGFSQDTRSQSENRRRAFLRMTKTSEFKAWHSVQVSRALGQHAALKERVDSLMDPRNLLVEIVVDGRWQRDRE